MVEHKSRKKRWMPEPKMLVIALCVLISIPSMKAGVLMKFEDDLVDHWEFAFGASSKEIKYDYCKYNATSKGMQCKSLPQASTDIRKVCNCTVQRDETNEGSFFAVNCKSDLSHCPKKLSLTYEQGSYSKSPDPDPDVTTSGINGWLVVSIISIAVNVLLLTTNILCLINDKVRAFLKGKGNQLCSYPRRIYSRIIHREQVYENESRETGQMKESGMSNEWDDNINPTVSTGKHLGKPKGRADLGFFEDSNNEKNSARNICVLFIHYNFYGIKDRERDGDKEDVVTLEKSFYDDRNCHFRSLSSPRKDHLLQLLSDQDKLLSLFDLTADGGPSVLVLVFLSQGKEGEKILTDHRDVESNDFEHLTKKEVNDALEKLNKFKTSLPTLTIFCPCRGGSDEETIRSESCRITSTGMHNAAVPFSTFDSTSAPLDSTPIQQLREKTIENDAII